MKLKAEITYVEPSVTLPYGFRRGWYRVEDENHYEHIFFFGSMGAPTQNKNVGDEGTIEFRVGPSYGAYFWEESENECE